MKSIYKVTTFSAIVLLATSCTLKNIRSEYRLLTETNKGILAVGLTTEDGTANFILKIRKVGSSSTEQVTFYTVYDPLIWQRPRGRLVNVELEQGDYEFFDLAILAANVASATYYRIPFSINAGRVTYHGRLHLQVDKGYASFIFKSSNHYPEDFNILKTKITNLDAGVVDQVEAIFFPCREAACVKPFRGNVNVPVEVLMYK
jgi:hypothetical protein